MMRYYFDIDDGVENITDGDGVELTSDMDARNEAVATLPELAKDLLPNGASHDFTITIRDQYGRRVFRAKLALTSEWL